jgi:uncharacterized membrane protein
LSIWHSNYKNHQLINFKIIWILNYSLCFVAFLSFVNLKKIKNQSLGYVSIALSIISLLVFLIQGFSYSFPALRGDYLYSLTNTSILNIGIRYISFIFLFLLLYTTFLHTKASFISKKFRTIFDILLHFSILWIVSSEFLHWSKMFQSENYRILSVLWGIYALLLIILGIWKKRKHLRISAMVLFGIVILKLFVYDITHLGTIAKTIVFVSLGIILLIISFLYNKYKRLISDEESKENVSLQND